MSADAPRPDRFVDPESLHRELVERLQERCPGWEARREDPASVILELWARLAGELGDRLASVRQDWIDEVVAALGCELPEATPARGLVTLDLASGAEAGEPPRLPAGTPLVVDDGSGEGVRFETTSAVWLNTASLARAFVTSRLSLVALPVGDAVERPVELFARPVDSGRQVYVGDARLGALDSARGAVAVDWPGDSRSLQEAFWEYRSLGGWRPVEPTLELADRRGERILRTVFRGPLAGMAITEELGSQAARPWLRAHLPVERPITIGCPSIGARGEPARGLVERAYVRSFGRVEDISAGVELLEQPERPQSLDPAVILGFDGPGPHSLHVELDVATTPSPELLASHACRPQLAWEVLGPRGWSAVDREAIDDATLDLQRSGSIDVDAISDWKAERFVGESLFWLRACWRRGEYLDAPSVRALRSRAVQIEEGHTQRDVVLGEREGDRGGWIVPSRAGAWPQGFEEITLASNGESRTCLRLRSGNEGEAPMFSLRRDDDGALQLRLHGGSGEVGGTSAGDRVTVPEVRYSVGSRGNQSGNLSARLDDASPTRASVRVVASPHGGAGGAGQSGGTRQAVRREVVSVLLDDDRLVTADDFRRAVLRARPQVERVLVQGDPDRPGVTRVMVLAGLDRPSPIGGVTARSLERHLQDRTAPGWLVELRELAAPVHALRLKLDGRFSARPLAKLSADEEARLRDLLWRGLRQRLDVAGRRSGNDDAAASTAIFALAGSLSGRRLQDAVDETIATAEACVGLRCRGIELAPPHGSEGRGEAPKYVKILQLGWERPDE